MISRVLVIAKQVQVIHVQVLKGKRQASADFSPSPISSWPLALALDRNDNL